MTLEILGFHVGDVQKAVAADREINERGLNRRFEIHDLSLVDIAGIAFVAGALNIKLFKDAVLDNRDAAFLGLEHVDQHFFLHTTIFLTQSKSVVVGRVMEPGGSVSVGRVSR